MTLNLDLVVLANSVPFTLQFVKMVLPCPRGNYFTCQVPAGCPECGDEILGRDVYMKSCVRVLCLLFLVIYFVLKYPFKRADKRVLKLLLCHTFSNTSLYYPRCTRKEIQHVYTLLFSPLLALQASPLSKSGC